MRARAPRWHGHASGGLSLSVARHSSGRVVLSLGVPTSCFACALGARLLLLLLAFAVAFAILLSRAAHSFTNCLLTLTGRGLQLLVAQRACTPAPRRECPQARAAHATTTRMRVRSSFRHLRLHHGRKKGLLLPLPPLPLLHSSRKMASSRRTLHTVFGTQCVRNNGTCSGSHRMTFHHFCNRCKCRPCPCTTTL